MALTKQKKVSLIGELETIVKGSASIAFVHMKKVPVSVVTALRETLRSQEGGLRVVKKTLFKRALQNAQITGDVPVMEGEVAIAYGKDLTMPAREIFAFSKGKAGNVVLQGGVFDGRFMNQAEMLAIATIPPTPVLRGMFVNIINSPIQRFVVGLGAIAEKKATSA